MTSFFAVALGASGAVQDSVYGEAFLADPQTKPKGDVNGRAGADPARPSQTFTGVWTDPHATILPANRTGHPAQEGAGFGSDKPTVDFETTALPYALMIGDLVTRVATGARYAVSDPGADGFTRSSVALTAARGRS